jgi:very-short-patch-repair endonuclease
MPPRRGWLRNPAARITRTGPAPAPPVPAPPADLPVTRKKPRLSPIERQFWDAWLAAPGRYPALAGLVAQHKAGRYRLDFALPAQRIGIELDGFASHSSTADITRDRQRQRELEADGWRIIRFGGAEVYQDAAGCVRQAARLASLYRGAA